MNKIWKLVALAFFMALLPVILGLPGFNFFFIGWLIIGFWTAIGGLIRKEWVSLRKNLLAVGLTFLASLAILFSLYYLPGILIE